MFTFGAEGEEQFRQAFQEVREALLAWSGKVKRRTSLRITLNVIAPQNSKNLVTNSVDALFGAAPELSRMLRRLKVTLHFLGMDGTDEPSFEYKPNVPVLQEKPMPWWKFW